VTPHAVIHGRRAKVELAQAAWQSTGRRCIHKHLQTEAGDRESWQLVSYVHSEVNITIQWDGGGGPRVTGQQVAHKSVSVYRIRG